MLGERGSLRACYALPGTDVGYVATAGRLSEHKGIVMVCPYAVAMRCPAVMRPGAAPHRRFAHCILHCRRHRRPRPRR
eukprot:880897-Rhodomonas_salina.3